MKQRAKRVTVVLLAAAFAVILGVGLLIALLPDGARFADKTAELGEEDLEFNYASSFAYSADTEETSGDNGVYGWGYDTGNEDKEHATYAYITKIDSSKLADLKEKGVTKIVINIPETHNKVPVKFIQQDAFNNCELTIIDIKMPLSVYWQIKGSERFTFDNNFDFARADGLTATFTAFKPASGSGITTLILPSNVWIDQNSDNKMGDNEPTYRYTEYLFEGNSGAAYSNLVVMPDVVNIFNGKATDSNTDRPKMQGGLLSKSKKLESVYFCTGRTEVLHLYPLTFENCTSLKEISLSAGVYLEDGARVFQGSSALEKFFVADEKTASAPLFYTVGADGALYTNNYAFSYFTQPNTEKYYEWWKKGNPTTGYESEISPTKAYDYNTKISGTLSEDETAGAKVTFKGDTSSTDPDDETTYYYAIKESGGKPEGGIGIPEGSYVFDVNGTDKHSNPDPDNDFATGNGEGQYESTADFQSTTLTTSETENKNGTKATISTSSGEITVTEVGGSTQDQAAITIDGVEYKSRMQFKQGSKRYLKIVVPFDFDLCVYFAGAYASADADGASKPRMGLFDSSNFKETDYQNNKNVGKNAKTAQANNALATLADVTGVSITEDNQHLLKIEGSKLQAKKTYYIAQPSDDTATSGYAQMFFLVITPLKEQSANSITVQRAISFSEPVDKPEEKTAWEPLRNGSVLLRQVNMGDSEDPAYAFVDRQYPTLRFNGEDKYDKLYFRAQLRTAAGEPIKSQDLTVSLMQVDGKSMNSYLTIGDANDLGGSHTAFQIDSNGYFRFYVQFNHNQDKSHPNNIFSEVDYTRQGITAVIRLSAGDVTKDIYINFSAATDKTKIPDLEKKIASSSGTASPTPSTVSYLPLAEENVSRYQKLVSMPAKAMDDDGEYVNSFNFGYHETVEIGPNAFQNTFITVIDIPDRIAKIGASAFRFSDRLQTVYLPDAADIGLNAFGQEADADNTNQTVYTAGKQNFFLIAPSRTSFEQYLKYASKYGANSGQKELDEPNYNVFPVHAEEDDISFGGRTKDGKGKDASYDYTPYLTYEITVDFLKYDATGGSLQGTETRTFLYGMDARYVKAERTTEWAKFDKNYDNNAPVWFGYISDYVIQQINTIKTDIPWSIAADGWYYDANAKIPAGDWYFGELQVTNDPDAYEETPEDEFTKFIGGWAGGHVNGNDIQNLAQLHYAEVCDSTYDVQSITETGQKAEEAGSLREPITYWDQDDDDYLTNTEFGKQNRWNRWWWNENYEETVEGHVTTKGAFEQRFFTMPFSITLKSKVEARESRLEYDVPTFQNIGEITYGEDTINAAPKAAQDSSWNVPMLTVTFDYNGFPVSRIFENFKSGVMEVEYKAWQKTYNNKQWSYYYPENDSANWTKAAFEGDENYGTTGMRENINGEWVPYDAGYYKITLSFSSEKSGDYDNYWSGVYNGMRVDVNAKFGTTFTFILNIQPRKVPLSNIYSMQYSGQGFSLFEDNPYIDVLSYSPWYHVYQSAKYTADGLPYAVGHYQIKLKLHDPKYPQMDGNNGYTPNLEWEGAAGYETNYGYTQFHVNDGNVNHYIYTDGVDLFILDGETEVPWGMLYEGDDEDVYFKFKESLAMFGSEVKTYTYTGAPIPLEDVFGGIFSASSIDYTITRNGSAVSEINQAGTYRVSITPAEGYVWWKGIPFVEAKAQFHIASWSLDEFWEKEGGYEGNERKTLTFEVNVNKRAVRVPRDSYVPTGAEIYAFEVPIGGDYEVVGYHMHDFAKGAEIPKAGDEGEWSDVITEAGVYDVLLRLTDPFNTTWYPDTGESRGDNFYVTALLYAGFDREKAYPTFQADLGTTEGEHTDGGWVTLTRTYDGDPLDLDALFGTIEDAARPTDKEAIYTIYKLSGEPDTVGAFFSDEEVEWIEEAGYYGITVILNDPFLFEGTTETVAYYLVHIEKAKITATFDLSKSGSNGGNATYDGSDHLKDLGDGNISFATLCGGDILQVGRDYNVVITSPDNTLEMIDAGTYTIKVELTSSDIANNYELTGGETEYVIDARPLTLDLGTIKGHTYFDTPAASWHDQEVFAYNGETDGAIVSRDGAADDLQLSYQFKLGEDTFSSLDALSNAGEYTVEAVCGNSNYTVILKEAYTYTVAAREIALNDIAGVTYDGTEHKPNVSFTGEKMVLVEDEDYTLTYAEDAASGAQRGGTGLPSKAGSYTVTVTLVSTNYTFADGESASAPFVINKATLAMPYLSPSIFTYSGEDISGNVEKSLSGNYDADMMEIAFYEKNDGTGEAVSEVKDAGTYYVKVTLNNLNYEWEAGTEPYLPFTVSKATYDMSGVTFESKSFVYDGNPHSLAATGLPEGVSVTYTTNEFVDVGEHTVTATFTGDDADNYEPIASLTATLTITKATVAVVWEEKSFTYTGAELTKPVATAQGVGEDGEIALNVTLNPAGGKFQNVGDYIFEAAFESGYEKAGNYFLIGTKKQYTVAKRVNASIGITAADVSATYGDTGEVLHPAVSGVPEGYQAAFLYTYEGIDGTTYALSSEAPANVGKYRVTVTAFYAGGANDEPFTAMATATLTIVARKLTFSLDSTEGTGGLVNAVFKDEQGNSVALAATDYTFTYSFNGSAVENMEKAGEYTITVTLKGGAVQNNELVNNTAVYTLTQDITGGTGEQNPGPSGGETNPDTGEQNPGADKKSDLDFGMVLILMSVAIVLLAVVLGLAVWKKKSEKSSNTNSNVKERK